MTGPPPGPTSGLATGRAATGRAACAAVLLIATMVACNGGESPAAPTADAGADRTVEVGDTVVLDASASTAPAADGAPTFVADPGGTLLRSAEASTWNLADERPDRAAADGPIVELHGVRFFEYPAVEESFTGTRTGPAFFAPHWKVDGENQRIRF